MKKYLFAASAVAAVAVGGAHAADVVHYQEPAAVAAPAPAFSWQGFYAGGQIGGSWGRGKSTGWTDGVHETFWSPKPDGFVGGLYAGYNFDVGNNVILGLETDFVWGDVKDSTTNRGEIGEDFSKERNSLKQQWNGATRVRAGYAVNRFLPYIAGGVAYNQLKNHYSYEEYVSSSDKFFYDSSNSHENFTGWTIGTGVDYAMTDKVLLRLEYRYSDFGNKKYRDEDGNSSKFKYKANDVRVGVAYKF